MTYKDYPTIRKDRKKIINKIIELSQILGGADTFLNYPDPTRIIEAQYFSFQHKISFTDAYKMINARRKSSETYSIMVPLLEYLIEHELNLKILDLIENLEKEDIMLIGLSDDNFS